MKQRGVCVRQRKTDYGTIILHWTFVAAFAVAPVTGLRIATETPDRTWINLFDAVLPRDSVWIAHMQAAIVLVAVAIGYTVYMFRSGLGRRVQLDKVRLRGLFGRGQARLGAVIALMYWIFFVTMAGLLISGGLLYFGFYSGYDVAMLHWVGTWVILAFVVLHVLTQYKSGGASQLLRIFRPAPLPAPPPRLDSIAPLGLLTGEGGNFDGKGEARIEIRAVHDGTYAYFLFTWQDSTRSLKHLPLVKEADGWHLLHSGFQLGDEHEYSEDKFSVLLTTSDVTLAGGRTFHPGPQPVAGAPATMSGRGLHYTAAGYAD